MKKRKMKLFKKIIFIPFTLIVFYACFQNLLRANVITDENISEFQNTCISLFADDTTALVGRKLEDTSKIFAKDSVGNEIPVSDLYCKFFKDNPEICLVVKDTKHLRSLAGNDLFRDKKSQGVLNIEHGARALLEKLPSGNDKIEVIFFHKYGYIPMLGNTQEGNAYVYSPSLDLSLLSSSELAIFGLAKADKMKFKNWFCTAPLG